ncbi:MAG: hypothetical protein AB7O77_04930 [Phycisphaerales bacterium]
MSLGKGLAFSALGALAGAIVWAILIQVSGWGLWLLAPAIGGAAGLGMMKATQMRGGVPAGVLAGAVAFIAIFGTRAFVVNSFVDEHLTATEDDAINAIAAGVAEEYESSDLEAYDEEGEYSAAVYAAAVGRWNDMTGDEQADYIAGMQQENDTAQAVLTPLALVFDFGIFGSLCTFLSVATAFKTGSMTLEAALIEKGHVGNDADAATMAAHLRGGGRAGAPMPSEQSSGVSRWTMPLPEVEHSDQPPLQAQPDLEFGGPDAGAAPAGDVDSARREAA